jgi:hypothetical protein
LNAAPGRRVHYSVGFDLDARARTAITTVPEKMWEHVWDRHGEPRDLDDAGVIELTGLLRASAGGDELRNWPPDLRITCRRERPSAGAQLCALEETDGWRYQLIATNTSGKDRCRPARCANSIIGSDHVPIWNAEKYALHTLLATPGLAAARTAALQRELLDVEAVLDKADKEHL